MQRTIIDISELINMAKIQNNLLIKELSETEIFGFTLSLLLSK